MTVTITSSLRVALVSGSGVTFDAPVVNLISTDDVYSPLNPAQTLTDLLGAVSSAKLVGSAVVDGTIVGNTSIFTVGAGEKFIPTSIVFALTDVAGSGQGPAINAGFTATDYIDYIDSISNTTYELGGGAIFAPGSGYLINDVLTLVGGTHTTASTITVDSASIVSLAVNAAGTIYAPQDTITLNGGVAVTRGIVTVQTVKLVSATIHAGGGGTGYGNAQTFNVSVAGGTHSVIATVNVTTSAGGVVNAINSVVGGNYSSLSTPALTLSGNLATGDNGSDHGTGLSLDLVFGINTVTITTNGEYTTEATTFTQLSTTSVAGTGATFNTALFGVVGYSISLDGVYTILPNNHIATTGGAGTGATFDATWTTLAGEFMSIAAVGQLVQVIDFLTSGDNYVYMTGGQQLTIRVAFPATFSTYTMKALVFGFTFS